MIGIDGVREMVSEQVKQVEEVKFKIQLGVYYFIAHPIPLSVSYLNSSLFHAGS